MHIILLVLKIIGIALLALLSAILLLLLLVLFVPVRYRINAEKQEDIKAKAVGTWLFSLLFVKAEYQQELLNYQIRVFGILIYPRKQEEKEKTREKLRKKHTGRKKNGKEPDLVTMEVREPAKPAPQQTEKPQAAKMIGEKKVENNKAVLQKEASRQEKSRTEQKEKPEEKPDEKLDEQPKEGWFARWKQKLAILLARLTSLRERWTLITDFLRLDENKKGLLEIWNSVKHIIRHILPRKIVGEIKFGLEDPCSTGQALGFAGALYAIYGQSVRVIPNFEEVCLKGEIFIKGRIRVFTLLRICIKLLLDKNFKRLRINFEKMKEAL